MTPTKGRIAFLRVVVIDEDRRGEVVCQPVGSDLIVSPTKTFLPGHIIADPDTLVDSPMELESDEGAVHYGGRPFNRAAMSRRPITRKDTP